jgi:hypothetical protein
MMIDRRTFVVQGATLLAAAPALADVLTCLPPTRTPLVTRAEVGSDENSAVFKIHGWDGHGGEASSGNEVWLSINQSWRAAWR